MPKSHGCTRTETREKRNLTYLLMPAKQHAHGLAAALAGANARGYRRHLGEAGRLRREGRLGTGVVTLGHALVAVTTVSLPCSRVSLSKSVETRGLA